MTPPNRSTKKVARTAATLSTDESADGVQALRVAFRILDELSLSEAPMGVTELADALGELKSRVHRHLATLKQLGAVYQDSQSGKYRLGSKMFALGEAAVDQFDLRHLAAPYLTRLRDLTQQTALLSVPANGEPIVLACVEYRDRISITSRPGNRPPSHCSSQGRVILAFAPDEVRKRILLRKLPAFTKFSLTDPRIIEERLKIIRKEFYEDANHEVMRGINALSAPVFSGDGDLVAVMGILGTSEEIPSPPPGDLIRHLHSMAGALSAELKCSIYYQRGLVR